MSQTQSQSTRRSITKKKSNIGNLMRHPMEAQISYNKLVAST